MNESGTLQNPQLGNSQIAQNPDGSATVVLYENCSIDAFLSGRCLEDFQTRQKAAGQHWSTTGDWPTQLSP